MIALHSPSIEPDRMSWHLEPSSHSMTKMLYRCIADTAGPEELTQIWAVKLPLKFCIFLWHLICGRVPSREEVLKRNGRVEMVFVCYVVCRTILFFTCVTAQYSELTPGCAWGQVVLL